MIRTLIKNWWLLALCGVIDAISSAIYFMHKTGFYGWSTIAFLGELALAAAVCTIAAGIWRSANGKCWLLVLNGLAFGTLGLLLTGIAGFSIGLRTIALLLVVMAMSIGILQLIAARTLRRRRHVVDEWVLGLAGAASAAFAVEFLAWGFGWIKLGPESNSDLLSIAYYFAFTAICMLGLALRLHSRGIDTEFSAA